MRRLHAIVAHYLLTPPQWCDQFQTMEEVVQEVTRWHRDRTPPFRTIGYHYVVGIEGEIVVGRLLEEVGAHVGGQNVGTVGVAYVGGLDEDGNSADTRTSAQRDAMHELFLELRARFGELLVVGHRDLAPSKCPGYDAGPDFLAWQTERKGREVPRIDLDKLPVPVAPRPEPLPLPASLRQPVEVLSSRRVHRALRTAGYDNHTILRIADALADRMEESEEAESVLRRSGLADLDILRIAAALEPAWRLAEAHSRELRVARYLYAVSRQTWVGVREAVRSVRP